MPSKMSLKSKLCFRENCQKKEVIESIDRDIEKKNGDIFSWYISNFSKLLSSSSRKLSFENINSFRLVKLHSFKR